MSRFSIGAFVGVGMDETGEFEIRRIDDIVGNTLHFGEPLERAHDAGAVGQRRVHPLSVVLRRPGRHRVLPRPRQRAADVAARPRRRGRRRTAGRHIPRSGERFGVVQRHARRHPRPRRHTRLGRRLGQLPRVRRVHPGAERGDERRSLCWRQHQPSCRTTRASRRPRRRIVLLDCARRSGDDGRHSLRGRPGRHAGHRRGHERSAHVARRRPLVPRRAVEPDVAAGVHDDGRDQ